MSTTSLPGRPVGVTIVAVVVFLQGIIGLLLGIGLIVERNNASLIEHVDRSSSQINAWGWIGVILGVVALIVAWGLWAGGGWARILIGVLELLNVAGGVYMLFAWSGHYLWQGIWQIVLALFVLWLLFNPRADRFFAGR